VAEFINFYVRTTDEDPARSTIVTIQLKQPIKLYDEEYGSPYRRALISACKKAKAELGLHPCCQVHAEPDDWSDGVEELSELAWRGEPA
jgi:hypothetical protein